MHSSPDEEVAVVLDSLRRLVHQLRVAAYTAERELGVTGAQLFVLRELASEPGISIRRLSDRTLTDPSSVSVVVARLVESNLIVRRRDPGDARKSVLSVSARGLKLLARAPEPYQTHLIEALRRLPRAQLRHLRLGLSALLPTSARRDGVVPLFFEEAVRKKASGKRRVKPFR